MTDNRVKKLADILVNYSCDLKKGEKIVIAGDIASKPLIIECYKEAIKKGAQPFVKIHIPEASKLMFDLGSDEQISYKDPVKKFQYENMDALINIYASQNLKMFSSVSSNKQVLMNKSNKELIDIVMSKKWVAVNYPTNALAQEAGMSLEEYEDFVFGATLINWEATKKEMKKVKETFDNGKEVKILGNNTQLSFSIENRPGIICSGENNMPDGEVFYSPVKNSVNGEIYYEFPAIYQGKEVDGIKLTFENGKVVKAVARKNQEFLNTVLDTDEGARYVGEFGIGLNYGIRRFTKDILFDEKIGGTVHFAVGQSYEEAGGDNDSAVHWDMIKDLRKHGQIFLDGKLVQQNGDFLI
ncbi:MAG: aminopeptidase [Candidatus Muiribacteriota bacterium]